MTVPAIKVEHGRLYWRGSTDHFSYMPGWSVVKLRDLFAADPSEYAQDFVHQINGALAELESENV